MIGNSGLFLNTVEDIKILVFISPQTSKWDLKQMQRFYNFPLLLKALSTLLIVLLFSRSKALPLK